MLDHPENSFPDRHTLIRQVNEQRVLECILLHGPTSRVEVSKKTGLSKPTVNAVVRRLVDTGLVRQAGQTSGSVGRSATLFAVDGKTWIVVGIDLGGTKVRVAIADLHGDILAEGREDTDRRGGRAVLSQIDRLARGLVAAAEVNWNRVVVASLSAPGVFEQSSDHVELAPNLPGFGSLALRKDLEAALGVDVVVDNDVNLAAVGERWLGMAQEIDDFAFVAVGTGIGMGLVSAGKVVHGRNGAAGEIGYLPIGSDPFTHPEVLARGPLEEIAAASGIQAALRAEIKAGTPTALTLDSSVLDIFAAADSDDAAALAVIDQEARWLALAVVAVAAVVNPALFVLGGGIGANPRLAPAVQSHLKTIAPFDIEVVATPLGDRASLVGALAVGLEIARRRLFAQRGEHSG